MERALVAFVFLAVGACDCGDDGRGREPLREEPTEPDEPPPPAPPSRGEFRALPAEGAPAGRDRTVALFTGREVIVWGGHARDNQFETYLNSGAAYDPARDAWTALPTEQAPSARMDHTAVGTGFAMIVWGGRDGMAPLANG